MPQTDWRDVDRKLIDGNTFSDQTAVYEIFKKMRREDPVHWTLRDDGVRFWSVFKHRECRKTWLLLHSVSTIGTRSREADACRS